MLWLPLPLRRFARETTASSLCLMKRLLKDWWNWAKAMKMRLIIMWSDAMNAAAKEKSPVPVTPRLISPRQSNMPWPAELICWPGNRLAFPMTETSPPLKIFIPNFYASFPIFPKGQWPLPICMNATTPFCMLHLCFPGCTPPPWKREWIYMQSTEQNITIPRSMG